MRRIILMPVGDGDRTVAAELETAWSQLIEVAGYREMGHRRTGRVRFDGCGGPIPLYRKILWLRRGRLALD